MLLDVVFIPLNFLVATNFQSHFENDPSPGPKKKTRRSGPFRDNKTAISGRFLLFLLLGSGTKFRVLHRRLTIEHLALGHGGLDQRDNIFGRGDDILDNGLNPLAAERIDVEFRLGGFG